MRLFGEQAGVNYRGGPSHDHPDHQRPHSRAESHQQRMLMGLGGGGAPTRMPPGGPNSQNGPAMPPGGFKTPEFLDRIREEYNGLQAQCQHFKAQLEKQEQEKNEMNRQFCMATEMQYAIQLEMAKASESCKRLHNMVQQMAHFMPPDMRHTLQINLQQAMNITPAELQVWEIFFTQTNQSINQSINQPVSPGTIC